jgi:hypothetical protein
MMTSDNYISTSRPSYGFKISHKQVQILKHLRNPFNQTMKQTADAPLANYTVEHSIRVSCILLKRPLSFPAGYAL